MLLGVLGEVRIAAGPQLLRERRCEVCKVPRAGDRVRAGRMTELPQRESQDMAVQRVVCVIGLLGREICFAQSPQQPFHVLQSGRPYGEHARRGHHEAARPGVAQIRLVRGDRACPNRDVPVLAG